MAAYVGGSSWGHLAQDRTFLLWGSFGLLFVAVAMNIVGLNIGKWLQNAGGVGTYDPLLLLIGAAVAILWKHGSATPVTWSYIWPLVNWDTVNFLPTIAFSFPGL